MRATSCIPGLLLISIAVMAAGCGVDGPVFRTDQLDEGFQYPRLWRPRVHSLGPDGVLVTAQKGIMRESGLEQVETLVEADLGPGTQTIASIDEPVSHLRERMVTHANASGVIVACWIRELDVRARIFDPSAGWGPPVIVRSNGSLPNEDDTLAYYQLRARINASGAAVVSWVRAMTDGNEAREWCVYDPVLEQWEAVESRDREGHVSAAIADDGTAWVITCGRRGGLGVPDDVGDIEILRKAPGSGWLRAHVDACLMTSRDEAGVIMEVDSTGCPICAWYDGDVRVLRCDPLGVWQQVVTLEEESWPSEICLTRDASRALLLCDREDPSVRIYANGAWGEAARPDFMSDARVALAEDGRAAMVSGIQDAIGVMRYDPTSRTWSDRETIRPPDGVGYHRRDVAFDDVLGMVIVCEELYDTPAGTPVARIGTHFDVPAEAAFEHMPDEPSASAPTRFDASTSSLPGGISSYEWDFENDGVVDLVTQQAIVERTLPPGTHDVHLCIKGMYGLQREVTEQLVVGDDLLTLTIVITDQGGTGMVYMGPLNERCTETCVLRVAPGTTVDLFPTPLGSSSLVEVIGCAPLSGVPLEGCSFTMTEDRTVEYVFGP